MTRRLTGFLALFLIAALSHGCKQEETSPSTQTETTATTATQTAATAAVTRTECKPSGDVVCVTLQITGIAHLIGDDGAKTRLLVVPNKSKIKHTPLLLTRKDFFAQADSLLDLTKDDAAGRTYYYREFPPGVGIDLVESGWEEPAQPELDFIEDGDPKIPCPGEEVNGTIIPRESLYWLPRLSTVSKHTGNKPTLKDAFTKLKPLASDVVTRLEIVDGRLDSRFAGDTIHKWKFERNGPAADDHVQAVTSYLLYTFPAKLKTVGSAKLLVLSGRKFSDNSLVTIARFKPDGGRVFITLANVIHDSFFSPNVGQEIEHFHEYYDVYDKNAPKSTKPKRKKKDDGSDDTCGVGPGGSGVECGPDRLP